MLPLFSQISTLTLLQQLYLYGNKLIGTIPPSVSVGDVLDIYVLPWLNILDVMPLGMRRSMSVYTNTVVCQHDHIVNN